jgi:hypothetical protein
MASKPDHRHRWFANLRLIAQLLAISTFLATTVLVWKSFSVPGELGGAVVVVRRPVLEPWLLIAIPTVERSPDKLNPTLDQIAAQMTQPTVSVLVVKVSAWTRAKKLISAPI